MKWVARLGFALLVVIAAAIVLAFALLSASVPQLDGVVEVRQQSGTSPANAAATAAVTIERDARGVATIRGGSREEVAFGTGFVHAQERFFQMDLSRRLAAAELTGLFGDAAAEQDALARPFAFRELARAVLREASSEERAVIASYARGVNAGLEALSGRPWEYWLLGSAPAPWRDEDTVLVVYAMWWDLQYGDWQREIVLRTLDAKLGGAVCASGWKCATEFFYPLRTEWDAPNTPSGSNLPFAMLASIPPPEAIDLRGTSTPLPSARSRAAARDDFVGSNNWAVAGRHTATGSALVASDMHLTLRVPATWFRARLLVEGGEESKALDLNGVTLPGAPTLVAGSNGHIAWAFTNSYGDWQDVVQAPCDAEDAGVQVARADGGQCWFVRWLAQVSGATNLSMLSFERARSVDEAVELAPRMGIPHQNLVVGDRAGRIAWTLIGRIPTASGGDRNRAPVEWLEPGAYPRIVEPASGRLWSANALTTADPAQEQLLGDDEAAVGVGYDLGARARQIRDGLLAIDRAQPADMLRVQLDDRAVFLARWRGLLLELLDEAALDERPARAEFRRLVDEWLPRASPESVGYRLVRSFQASVERATWEMLLAGLGIPAEETRVPARFEAPLWQLVTAQPPHLLASQYPSWRAFLLQTLDATLEDLTADCASLAECRWGDSRPIAVRHALSGALPVLSRFLDMPTYPRVGDADMPRVQGRTFGASNRFAVSPGHERDGYLHIAGGQSGHPLSPFYRAGFAEWAEGRPLPFLPGPAEHTLTLR